ncbi:MAG TPA: hypothetical protein VGP88_02775 [Thermoplasmata archaeon]|nr:hypothetical protein [Thermoplasmata archaeon]
MLFAIGWLAALGADIATGAATETGDTAWLPAGPTLALLAVRTAPEWTEANAPAPTKTATRIKARVAVVPSFEAQDRRIGQVTTFIT